MNADEIKRLYDRRYADTYDAKFLHSHLNAADTQHEIKLLQSFLSTAHSWLDVACGTGFFLRHFQDIPRVGLDLSPSMLEKSKRGNPDVEFVQHDFRDPNPALDARFDLVTCMWYAYGYVETMGELSQLVTNLASWTSPSGTCFVPLADPDLISRQTIPYHQHTHHKGEMFITGIVWSFLEDENSVHSHMLAPNLRFMVEQFQQFFEQVDVVRYPQVTPGVGCRPALIATGKRRTNLQGASGATSW